MQKWLKLCWPPLLAAGVLLLVLVGPFNAQEKKHTNKDLANSLRDVVNVGADMFNLRSDPAGCYRLYQGALLAVKPFVSPELQKEISAGIAKAEQMPSMSNRAFELRRVIDLVRAQMRGDEPPAKDSTKKDDVKKDLGKKDDVKKDGVKKDDVKKDGVKKDDVKKDGVKKDDVKKDSIKKDDVKKDAIKKDDVKKDGEKKVPPTKTLWDRLGGEDNVSKVVDDFVISAGSDSKVNVTRKGKFKVNVEELKIQLIAFISHNTGGPYKYTGKNMKDAHKGMGITNAEFDAAGGHLKAALEKNKAAPKDVDAVMALIGGTRKDIVEPAAKKDDGPKKDGDDKKDDGPKKDGELKVPPPVKTEKTSKLSGKATMAGKGLDLAYVTFVSEGNRKFTTLVKDGSYTFKTPIPEGQYRIILEPAGGEGVQVALPKSVRAADTSGLTTRVEGPQTVYDIVLQNK